jgi:uncharacterized protein YndB with AHSA1/START domain
MRRSRTMAPIVSTIEIACPPDEVFAYVTDPTRFAEWQRDVVSVRLDGPEPLRVGSRFTTTRQIGRTPRTMTQEITAIDAPRRWAARGVDGPIRPHADVTVEPLDGGTGARFTVALDFEGRGFGELLMPVVRRMAAKQGPNSYQNLKRLLESGRHRVAG